MFSDLPPLTLAHVVLSLIGIATGFVVIGGMLMARRLEGWTMVFLVTTVLTSVTGFVFFPFEKLLPSHGFGVLSLVLLTAAIVARYPKRMAGAWRPTYVVTAILAQYLNFFILIVQSFLKIPALHDMAPTQSEPPFAIAQGAALVLFGVLTVLAVNRFHPERAAAA
jgi:hypothetical protein